MTPLPLLSVSRFPVAALLAIGAAFAPRPLPAQPAEKRPLAIEDAISLRSVSSVAISPDGSKVAYVLAVPRKPFADKDGGAWAELHVAARDGASRPYVTGEVNVSNVAWTPDGASIAFLAKRSGDEEKCLYLIPVGGGESRRVLAHETGISEFSISSDGKRVAFVAAEAEPKRTKEIAEKGFKAEVYEERQRFAKVWIARPFDGESGAAEKPEKPKALDLPGHASDVRFSPDGTKLAVALAPTPLVDDQQMARRVHVVDAGTGAILAKIENPGKLGDVEWSPDGAHVAMISGADLNDPSTARLLVAPATGGAPKDVTRGFEGDVVAFAWQSGKEILFLADQGLTTGFHEVAPDGTGWKTIVPRGSHVLSGLSISRDGTKGAMIGSGAEFPAEAFVMAHGDAEPTRLTRSNPALDSIRFAKQEPFAYRARDGLDLEGVLIRPLGEEAGRRYPLLLVVHGGPEAHYRNGWLTGYSTPGQYAAARGYAVFYPNYRGSTGRGVEFAKSSQADPAGKEFDDLVDGVDALVRAGLVDERKVGVTGGSYGGYATAWCATKLTERFAAGVMMVGITDLVSKSGTTDIPNEMHLVHLRKHAADDWEGFFDRSPVRWVKQSKTPLLILHGKNDTRVHPSQSLELYRQLKLHGGAPVRLVYYPGEGHGNRNDPARYDYALRMMQWFDHYLAGPGGAPPSPDLEYGLEKREENEKPAQPAPAGSSPSGKGGF